MKLYPDMEVCECCQHYHPSNADKLWWSAEDRGWWCLISGKRMYRSVVNILPKNCIMVVEHMMRQDSDETQNR